MSEPTEAAKHLAQSLEWTGSEAFATTLDDAGLRVAVAKLEAIADMYKKAVRIPHPAVAQVYAQQALAALNGDTDEQ